MSEETGSMSTAVLCFEELIEAADCYAAMNFVGSLRIAIVNAEKESSHE